MVQPGIKGFFFGLLVLTLSACQESKEANATTEEQNFNACLAQSEYLVQKRDAKLQAAYKRIDPQSELAADNKSIFLKGQQGKGAVLLFHGILNSPVSLKLLAEDFNKKGLTVVAPLLAGFGSSVKVANASTLEGWQKSIDYHAKALAPCFESYALVGFSLGGALSTDFVLNRYPELYKNKKVSRVNSLLLLSPAIKPAENFVPLKANTTLLVTDAVPFWLISKIKNDPDIREMMNEPQKYNQHFPVYVGLGLYKLSKALEKSKHRFDLHSLPVSLDYSQADSATDWEETRCFLTDTFFDVRIFSYPKERNVPHSLFLKEKNEIGNQIRHGLASFVLRYTHSND